MKDEIKFKRPLGSAEDSWLVSLYLIQELAQHIVTHADGFPHVASSKLIACQKHRKSSKVRTILADSDKPLVPERRTSALCLRPR
jgi:hypothetical protein